MSGAITPLPWHVDHNIHIKAENGWRVASVNVPSGSVGSWGVAPSDNARFIVHAVNCHDDLLAALRGLLGSCTRTPVGLGDGGTYMVTAPEMDAIKAASAALAKAQPA